MRKTIGGLTLCLAASSVALGQGVSEADGKVVDRDGNPVADAVVTFYSASKPETKYSAKSNKKGRYFVTGMFSAVEEERWFMSCEAPGLAPVEVRVESRTVNRVLVGDIMTAKLRAGKAAPDIVIRPLGKATVDWTLAPLEDLEAEVKQQAAAAAEAAAAAASEQAAAPGKDPWLEALTLASAGSLEESVDLFRKAVAGEPENAERHETFAKILYRLEQDEEAEAEARRAVEIDPKRVESHLILFNVCDRRGDMKKARTVLDAALAAVPGDTRLLMRSGYVSRAAGDRAAATAAYKQVTEISPGNAEAWLELADLYAAAGDLTASEKAYQKVVDIDPAGAHQTYYNLGATIVKRSDASEADTRRAISAFRKALEIRPDYARAVQELAIALITVGERDAARETLQTFVTKYPQSADVPAMKALLQSLK